ncbi:MAG: ABC transporter permease [Limisphaerales bacterium]
MNWVRCWRHSWCWRALARRTSSNSVPSRALGEVEALEVLGIDPVHYLIVPRVIGMALGIFSLTVYLIIGAL